MLSNFYASEDDSYKKMLLVYQDMSFGIWLLVMMEALFRDVGRKRMVEGGGPLWK